MKTREQSETRSGKGPPSNAVKRGRKMELQVWMKNHFSGVIGVRNN